MTKFERIFIGGNFSILLERIPYYDKVAIRAMERGYSLINVRGNKDFHI